jgi:hypothetical protein
VEFEVIPVFDTGEGMSQVGTDCKYLLTTVYNVANFDGTVTVNSEADYVFSADINYGLASAEFTEEVTITINDSSTGAEYARLELSISNSHCIVTATSIPARSSPLYLLPDDGIWSALESDPFSGPPSTELDLYNRDDTTGTRGVFFPSGEEITV